MDKHAWAARQTEKPKLAPKKAPDEGHVKEEPDATGTKGTRLAAG